MTLFMNLLWSFFLVTLLALDVCVLAQNALSQSQRREILDAHNLFRSTVDPTATDMLKMLWNDELARVAQNHANRCIFDHNQNRASQAPSFSTVGENLFVTSAETVNYTAAVKAWYNEVIYYDYDLNRCSVECSQYTQVVWARTNMVGCGVTRCARVQNFPASDSFLLVCNYGPEGNVGNERPYRTGTPCSQCPANTDTCMNNLCKNDGLPTPATSGTVVPSLPATQPTVQPTTQLVQTSSPPPVQTSSPPSVQTTSPPPVQTSSPPPVQTTSPPPVQTSSATTDNNMATSPTAPMVDEEPPVVVEETEESTNGRSRSRARSLVIEETEESTNGRSRSRARSRTRTRTRTGTRTKKQSRMRSRSRELLSESGRHATKTGKKKGHRGRSRSKQNTRRSH